MADGGERREPRRRRRGPAPRVEPAAPQVGPEAAPKLCRKCGGRMYPADWIWQKYGLCVGWRCSKCKEKVMARSLPFKGLRKRTVDPDELPAATGEAPEDAEVRDDPGREGNPPPRRPGPARRPPGRPKR